MYKLFIIMLLGFVIGLSGCASNNLRSQADISMQNHYNQWVDSCKSFQDVENALQNFEYDMKENKRHYKLAYAGRLKELTKERKSPWLTFTTMTGICGDASIFAKHTLNKINPDYRANIICLESKIDGNIHIHYVCGFYLYHQLYIMDYGTPYDEIKGTHGPFRNLDEYGDYALKIYSKVMNENIKFKSVKWGWLIPEYETQQWRKQINNIPHIPAE